MLYNVTWNFKLGLILWRDTRNGKSWDVFSIVIQYVDLLPKCVVLMTKIALTIFATLKDMQKKKEKFIISKGYSILLLIPCDDF